MNKSKQVTKTTAKSDKKKNSVSTKPISGTVNDFTARHFIEKLKTYQSAAELKKIQGYFKSGKGEYGEGDEFMGVRMGQLFALAKEFIEMSPSEIEKLLESPIHEVRAGAMRKSPKHAGRNFTIFICGGPIESTTGTWLTWLLST